MSYHRKRSYYNRLIKILEDIGPQYIAVAFDLKGPTARHEMYEGYKANRHGMPEELAQQMPMIKDVLRAMNIDIIEKQGRKTVKLTKNTIDVRLKRKIKLFT